MRLGQLEQSRKGGRALFAPAHRTAVSLVPICFSITLTSRALLLLPRFLQPWVSMVWDDGSSLPSEREDGSDSLSLDAEPEALYNNEDFLLANETDIDESLSHTDKSGEAYLRPFSRVHLAAKLNIIAAPTLAVYHVDSERFLDWNVRMARLSPGREDATWERWLQGEGPAAYGFRGSCASPFPASRDLVRAMRAIVNVADLDVLSSFLVIHRRLPSRSKCLYDRHPLPGLFLASPIGRRAIQREWSVAPE